MHYRPGDRIDKPINTGMPSSYSYNVPQSSATLSKISVDSGTYELGCAACEPELLTTQYKGLLRRSLFCYCILGEPPHVRPRCRGKAKHTTRSILPAKVVRGIFDSERSRVLSVRAIIINPPRLFMGVPGPIGSDFALHSAIRKGSMPDFIDPSCIEGCSKF